MTDSALILTFDCIGMSFICLFQEEESGGAAELGLSNVGGVFVVLIGGLSIACIIAFCENLWNKRQQKRAALLVSHYFISIRAALNHKPQNYSKRRLSGKHAPSSEIQLLLVAYNEQVDPL